MKLRRFGGQLVPGVAQRVAIQPVEQQQARLWRAQTDRSPPLTKPKAAISLLKEGIRGAKEVRRDSSSRKHNSPQLESSMTNTPPAFTSWPRTSEVEAILRAFTATTGEGDFCTSRRAARETSNKLILLNKNQANQAASRNAPITQSKNASGELSFKSDWEVLKN